MKGIARWLNGILPIVLIAAMALPAAFGADTVEPADSQCPACRADFAIYAAENEPGGISEARALEAFLKKLDITSEIVTARELADGILHADAQPRYRGIISAGGHAQIRTNTLKGAARDNMRTFISRGGSYLAFCAGAYYAAVDLLWAEGNSVPQMNVPRDYQAIHTLNDLGVFTGGVAQGPFGWHPVRNGSRQDAVVVDTENPAMARIGIPKQVVLHYANGPFFTVTQPPPGYQVWARARAPEGTPANARIGDGEPSVVSYDHEAGKVILFAYHPVMVPYPNATDAARQELNFQSHNLLRAALFTALRRPVDPMPRSLVP